MLSEKMLMMDCELLSTESWALMDDLDPSARNYFAKL